MKDNMQKSFVRKLWINLLLLSYLLFSYNYFGGWWNSSAGSVLILIFGFLAWKKNSLDIIGMNLNIKTAIKTLLFAAIVIGFSLLVMKHIANKQNITIQFTGLKDYYHDIFYILNEEIVLGALALYLFIRKWKIKPFVASAALAILFASVHYIFYRWIFDDKGIIHVSTLITLFMIGFIRNNLIIVNGHIGYSWALHFGWMVVMFGCLHEYADTGMKISEADRFNTYLGSVEMLIISIALLAASIVFFKKGKPAKPII